MGKLESPLISLGARGTLGQAITFQKRNQGTIVREKPIPTYRRTLPQAYQRWLYEDYAYLWTQQTASTRQEYASAGSRHHLTGFQYWMKYHLTNLPDIMAMWHLDEKAGIIAYDSSRKLNHGTIFGATPADGIIDGAFLFDGLNDYVNCGTGPTLDFGNGTTDIPLTFEAWIKPADILTAHCDILSIWDVVAHQYDLIQLNNQTIILLLYDESAAKYIGRSMPFPSATYLNKWSLIHTTYDGLSSNVSPYGIKLYLDGVQKDTADVAAVPGYVAMEPTNIDFIIGRRTPGAWELPYKGTIDHLVLYNRILDQTEKLRHLARKYPP